MTAAKLNKTTLTLRAFMRSAKDDAGFFFMFAGAILFFPSIQQISALAPEALTSLAAFGAVASSAIFLKAASIDERLKSRVAKLPLVGSVLKPFMQAHGRILAQAVWLIANATLNAWHGGNQYLTRVGLISGSSHVVQAGLMDSKIGAMMDKTLWTPAKTLLRRVGLAPLADWKPSQGTKTKIKRYALAACEIGLQVGFGFTGMNAGLSVGAAFALPAIAAVITADRIIRDRKDFAAFFYPYAILMGAAACMIPTAFSNGNYQNLISRAFVITGLGRLAFDTKVADMQKIDPGFTLGAWAKEHGSYLASFRWVRELPGNLVSIASDYRAIFAANPLTTQQIAPCAPASPYTAMPYTAMPYTAIEPADTHRRRPCRPLAQWRSVQGKVLGYSRRRGQSMLQHAITITVAPSIQIAYIRVRIFAQRCLF